MSTIPSGKGLKLPIDVVHVVADRRGDPHPIGGHPDIDPGRLEFPTDRLRILVGKDDDRRRIPRRRLRDEAQPGQLLLQTIEKRLAVLLDLVHPECRYAKSVVL